MSNLIMIFLISHVTYHKTYCAPKTGHPLFDPLAFEANELNNEVDDDDFLSNDELSSPTINIFTTSIMSKGTQPILLDSTLSSVESTTSITVEEGQQIKTLKLEYAPGFISNSKLPKIVPMITKSTMPFPIWKMLLNITDYQKTVKNSASGNQTLRHTLKICKKSNLRNDNEETGGKPEGDGYEYNVKICKQVNSRIICGYNKNLGEFTEDDIKDIGNGCRIRGDRIECGYLDPPFNNPRRPPSNANVARMIVQRAMELDKNKHNFTDGTQKNTDTTIPYQMILRETIEEKQQTSTITTNNNDPINETQVTSVHSDTTQQPETISSTNNSDTTTEADKSSSVGKIIRACVEKDERIVCYYF